MLGDIWEDGILVVYLHSLTANKCWGALSRDACGWKGKSGQLSLRLFPETEPRQSHDVMGGVQCGEAGMGSLDIEGGVVVDGSTGHQPT